MCVSVLVRVTLFVKLQEKDLAGPSQQQNAREPQMVERVRLFNLRCFIDFSHANGYVAGKWLCSRQMCARRNRCFILLSQLNLHS